MRYPTGKFNIAVVTFPFYTAVPQLILANFLGLLEPLSNKIYVITGRFTYESNPQIHIINIRGTDRGRARLKRVIVYLLAQPRVAFNLFKIVKDIDVVLFFLGTRTYLLPLLTARLLRKKTSLMVTGSESKAAKMAYSKKLFGLGSVYSTIVGILERINFRLADQMAVESESTIGFQGLGKYRRKIVINGAMYIDTNLFAVRKELKNRENLVGYVGRIAREKGVLNFISALPVILRERESITFLVGGDGPLFVKIKSELEDKEWRDKVKLTGWIPHDELPDYFREIKLLVLPSENEGVPGIIQEAMACGTPVLATAVGAIPDLIQDEKTGFILENNSPECIARNVLRALEHPKLEEIAQNARKLIEQEWAYQPMVEKCQCALDELLRNKKS